MDGRRPDPVVAESPDDVPASPDGGPAAGADPAVLRPGAMELLQLVMSTPGVEAYLDEVAAMAQGVSPAIAGVGVTLRRHGQVLSVATSNALAGSVDEVQYGMDTGPCLETLRTGHVVHVPEVTEESRWGGYPDHALSRGVRSSLSLPLRVGGTTVGALNVYAVQPRSFTAELAEQLSTFAAQAQVALALALRSTEQSDAVEQLHAAMQSRSVIDQALGILMARQQCTADEAFAVLRAGSQSRNRKIADIAAEIITATTGHAPRPGRFEL
ncbi:GAF and ANTAR domain-containing protein [uncultured Cellulomonas sp.]|uniref:GAF and ANTAR domain-containing protein n=1 Tax=uncultured Cellulomonas sp. TaxID=189682 RepID=UPI00262286F4|nr:GAF and ANTAR domain-containing protein [uncultured Cellulomonas sp.]